MTKQLTITLGKDNARWMKAVYEVIWQYDEGTPLCGRFIKWTNLETGKELPKKLQCTFSYQAAAKDAIRDALKLDRGKS